MENNRSHQHDQNYFEFLMIQYQVLSDQQLSHNSLVWSTPSLLFVAQTFLWGTALNNDINIVVRCFIAFTSIMISFASVHGFSRNRLMEIADCMQLSEIERQMSTHLNPLVVTSHCQLKERTITRYGKKEILIPELYRENKDKKTSESAPFNFKIWSKQIFERQKVTLNERKCTSFTPLKWRPLNRYQTFTIWEIVLWIFLLFSIALFVYNLYFAICSTPKDETSTAMFLARATSRL